VTSTTKLVAVLLVGSLLGALSLPLFAASFTPIGEPYAVGEGSASALGVSDNGSVVVGASTREGAFVWTPTTGMFGLGTLNGRPLLAANSVSADGSVVVGRSDIEAFRWTPDTGVGALETLGGQTAATSVSADGLVVGGFRFPPGGGSRVLRWGPDGSLHEVVGRTAVVSGDGTTIVGQFSTSTGTAAYKWVVGGSLQQLATQSRWDSAADVSADGSIVVGSINAGTGGDRPVIWTTGQGALVLGVLPGQTFGGAVAVSGDGSVVVGASAGGPGDIYGRGGARAFVWTAQAGMWSLFDVLVSHGVTGLEGWRLTSAIDISSDGQWVVGDAFDPLGRQVAFLANISQVPIPAAAWLFGSALGLVGWMRRRAP